MIKQCFTLTSTLGLLALLNFTGCKSTSTTPSSSQPTSTSGSVTSNAESALHKDSFTSIADDLRTAAQQEIEQGGISKKSNASDLALAQSVVNANTQDLALNLADPNIGGAVADAYAEKVSTINKRQSASSTQNPSAASIQDPSSVFKQKKSSTTAQEPASASDSSNEGANIAVYVGAGLFGVGVAGSLIHLAVQKRQARLSVAPFEAVGGGGGGGRHPLLVSQVFQRYFLP